MGGGRKIVQVKAEANRREAFGPVDDNKGRAAAGAAGKGRAAKAAAEGGENDDMFSLQGHAFAMQASG
jgi:hypothetical protein